MHLQVESFTIHNGQVPCQFEFINKPDETSYCKQWLNVNPSRGFLLPGKASAPSFLVAGLGDPTLSAHFPNISFLFLSVLLSERNF